MESRDHSDQDEDLVASEFESSICDLNLHQLDNLFWFKASQKFIKFSCTFNRINIFNYNPDCKLQLKNLARLFSIRDTQTGDRCYWSFSIQLFQMIMFVKLIVATYNSYQFDFQRLSYDQHLAAWGDNKDLPSEHLEELRGELDDAQGNLLGLGLIYKDTSFVIEIFNLFILGLVFSERFLAQVIFEHFNVDYKVGALMLDFKTSRRAYLDIVMKEVRLFIVSARNFHYLDPEGAADPRKLKEQLRSMLSAGMFAPLTWQLDWIKQLASISWLVIIYLHLFGVSLALLVFVGLPFYIQYDKDEHHNSMWNLIYAGDEFVSEMLTLVTGVFYAIVAITSISDHTRHTNRLIRLIEEVRLSNCIDHLRIVRLIQSKAEVAINILQHHDKTKRKPTRDVSPVNRWRINRDTKNINKNLLFALIHYKISSSLARTSTNAFVFYVIGGTIIFLQLPIQTLLHGPYFDREQVKYTYTLICLGSMISFNFIVVPMCYMHNRSFALYKAMSSLLAHLVECQTALRELEEPTNFDNHLVCLLRKELNHPNMMTRQFTIVTLGVPITYPNLVRIHFWFGIMMLASLTGVSSPNDATFGNIFSDPFSLF